jgi:hypothetical protein
MLDKKLRFTFFFLILMFSYSNVIIYDLLLSKDASFFTHYYSHNVYSVKIKLNLEAKNALEK